jgi:hypothetical protein
MNKNCATVLFTLLRQDFLFLRREFDLSDPTSNSRYYMSLGLWRRNSPLVIVAVFFLHFHYYREY